ncbi:LIC_13387 family protein [Fulvivirga sedimenti]|uniref:Uncharacterized protein n=1 Tax=Fulvivirga sedimenti TaxID=2879465 RepID=A0A9X1HWW0_9BACT|nr:hypothetical protein [Fulvivirga sedimenti]MCA6078865.1 hypothetical protein [Fulvivirga sedimenti]
MTAHRLLRITAFLQILTALIHASSYLAGFEVRNPTEAQLFELMSTYQANMGGGFSPTYLNLFNALSACFSLLYLFAGLSNLYFLHKNRGAVILDGFVTIQIIVLGFAFMLMALFTFLPPIILTGMVWVLLLMVKFSSKQSASD